RSISDGQVSAPVAPRGQRSLLDRRGEVTAVGSEAGTLYGPPIERFTRFWLLAGEHTLFVVDRIRAARPVTTVWNWLLNHRDDESTIAVLGPHAVAMRRRLAGLKLFHLAGARLNGPIYAHVHDAYHPEPDQLGEGRSGSGWLYRWMESSPREFRVAVHAVAVDHAGQMPDWAATSSDREYSLANGEIRWTLEVESAEPLSLLLRSEGSARKWRVAEVGGRWTLVGG
ncbi:MAG: hypothetical protein U1E05_25730, partial [Patescibacteria group bacterium]|nr:hypothetical protein [Patescibacteria group bacterium]